MACASDLGSLVEDFGWLVFEWRHTSCTTCFYRVGFSCFPSHIDPPLALHATVRSFPLLTTDCSKITLRNHFQIQRLQSHLGFLSERSERRKVAILQLFSSYSRLFYMYAFALDEK